MIESSIFLDEESAMYRSISLAAALSMLFLSTEMKGEEVSLVTAPPVVVKTIPEAGAMEVDAGLKEIRVTFSKEMTDGSWSWSTAGAKDKFPKGGKIRYEKDGKTCVMPVELEPGKEYVLGLNWGKHGNFKDRDGRPAVSYLLVFKTAEK